MKRLIFALTILCSVQLWAASAADPTNLLKPTEKIRLVYSSTNVTTAAWVQIDAATLTFATKIEIFDSSGQTMKLGTGTAGNEVDLPLIITPGGNGLIPVQIPQGKRLVVRAVSGTANTGELDINIYN